MNYVKNFVFAVMYAFVVSMLDWTFDVDGDSPFLMFIVGVVLSGLVSLYVGDYPLHKINLKLLAGVFSVMFLSLLFACLSGGLDSKVLPVFAIRVLVAFAMLSLWARGEALYASAKSKREA